MIDYGGKQNSGDKDVSLEDNPANGNHQTVSHWQTQWNTYLVLTIEEGEGKTQQNGSKLQSRKANCKQPFDKYAMKTMCPKHKKTADQNYHKINLA